MKKLVSLVVLFGVIALAGCMEIEEGSSDVRLSTFPSSGYPSNYGDEYTWNFKVILENSGDLDLQTTVFEYSILDGDGNTVTYKPGNCDYAKSFFNESDCDLDKDERWDSFRKFSREHLQSYRIIFKYSGLDENGKICSDTAEYECQI